MPSQNETLQPLVCHANTELAEEVRRRAALDQRSTSGWIRLALAKALLEQEIADDD